MDVVEEIGGMGLIPVVVLKDAERAVPTARAILDGGINTMEITLRTPQGMEAVRRVRRDCPEIIVGAGTVITLDQAKKAAEAGTQYIVTPGFDPAVVDWCRDNGIPVIPGCVTPSEIMTAMQRGLRVLKFFPADTYGGPAALKALHGPFGDVRFIPTGGVSIDNLSDYADKAYVHAIGGGWLCKSTDIEKENYQNITKAISESVAKLLDFSFVHASTNSESESAALLTKEQLHVVFSMEAPNDWSSIFDGCGIEIVKPSGYSEMRYITLCTNNVGRAAYHLRRRGYRIAPDSRTGKNGSTQSVDLVAGASGFVLRLLQK